MEKKNVDQKPIILLFCVWLIADAWLGHAKTYDPPSAAVVEKYQELFQVYEDCSSSLRQVFKKLADFRDSS